MLTESDSPPLFPAGEYVAPIDDYDSGKKIQLIERLELAPTLITSALEGLSESQLDTKYRNWSIRQIVHHLADSHINCYVRFKWTLTESTPTIKSYNETLWSEVVDAKEASIESSLAILSGIHERWGTLLRSLDEAQLAMGFFHPELDKVVTLKQALPSYVWHTDHHLAQIAWVRKRRI